MCGGCQAWSKAWDQDIDTMLRWNDPAGKPHLLGVRGFKSHPPHLTCIDPKDVTNKINFKEGIIVILIWFRQSQNVNSENENTEKDVKSLDIENSTDTKSRSHESHRAHSSDADSDNSASDTDSLSSSPFSCYECIRRKKKRFNTDSEDDYKTHFVQRHPGKPAFPGKADLKLYGWKAQGKEWEV